MSSLLDCALLYANKLNWPVFPCVPGQKRPATPRGCKDATTDERQIREWWTQNPRANIAIATGPTAHVYALDVDHNEDIRMSGYPQVSRWIHMGLMPKTPVQFSPRMGCHYLFSSETPIPCVQSPQYFPGLDVRGIGGYILVAPSKIGNRHYQWNPRRHPLSIPLASFPDWIRPTPACCKEETGCISAHQCTDTTTGSETCSTEEIIDRAYRYVATCDPAIQGSRGHDKLLWAATALVHGFCLSNKDAYDILAESYNPRCVPPWNLSVVHERNDFARKITEARRLSPKRQRGWLLNL